MIKQLEDTVETLEKKVGKMELLVKVKSDKIKLLRHKLDTAGISYDWIIKKQY